MEELEQMREQLTLLKQKLDQQEIISDKLLRNITSERVKRLNRAIWIESLAVLFVITFGNYTFYQQGCSIAFITGTTLLMIACFLVTIIPHHQIDRKEIVNGSLIEVAKQVMKLRKLYQKWLYFGIPAIVIWLSWYILELYYTSQNTDIKVFLYLLIGIVIGTLAGAWIGNRQRKQMIQEMDIILNDIADMAA